MGRSLWVVTFQRKIPEISVKCQMEQVFSGKTEVLQIFRLERNLPFTDSSLSRLFFHWESSHEVRQGLGTKL